VALHGRVMRSRPVAAVLLATLLVIGACSNGDDDDVEAPRSTTTSTTERSETNAAPLELVDADAGGPGFPVLLAAHDHSVEVLREGQLTEVASIDVDAWLALDDGVGGVIVERRVEQGRSELLRVTPEGEQPIDTSGSGIFLHDVIAIDGTPHIVYTTLDEETQAEVKGYVVLQNLATGEARQLAPAFQPEYSVERVSSAVGVLVASAFADLTESFDFFTLDGEPVPDISNPTRDLPYASPPLLAHAVLSTDGSQIAYLEGPDWDGVRQREVGEWVVVIRNLQTGEERYRALVGGREIRITWMDFDGRWLVISRETADDELLPPVLIDTHAPRRVGQVMSAVIGNVTLGAG